MTDRWLLVCYGYGLIVSVSLGYFLLRIPIQVTDSFLNMLVLDRPFGDLMRDMVLQPGYLRPGLWAGLKIVYALSGGEYFYWFRMTQVLQASAVILLFIRLLEPRTMRSAAVVPLAVAILIGSHTFAWTVREAYPINTFLTIVLCCAAAANLVCGESRWWRDAAGAALFVAASLTVESGLLVGVILVGGRLIGLRGISRTGALVCAGLFAAYAVVRFLVLDVGAPSLVERESGFGFARLTGEELAARFGSSPLGFYLYNVFSSAMGVLFAEPRDGVWRFVLSIRQGSPDLALAIGVLSTSGATLVIAAYVWSRRAAWSAWQLDRDDRLVLLSLLVVGGNAALSFAYTKDVIMSPAGFFFAVASFVAIRDWLIRVTEAQGARYAAGVACLAVLSVTWGIRDVGLHAGLAHTAYRVREQWAYVDDFLLARGYHGDDDRVRTLRRTLQDDAVLHHPAKPPVRERWTAIFETE